MKEEPEIQLQQTEILTILKRTKSHIIEEDEEDKDGDGIQHVHEIELLLPTEIENDRKNKLSSLTGNTIYFSGLSRKSIIPTLTLTENKLNASRSPCKSKSRRILYSTLMRKLQVRRSNRLDMAMINDRFKVTKLEDTKAKKEEALDEDFDPEEKV